jgi:hypothetical protein
MLFKPALMLAVLGLTESLTLDGYLPTGAKIWTSCQTLSGRIGESTARSRT